MASAERRKAILILRSCVMAFHYEASPSSLGYKFNFVASCNNDRSERRPKGNGCDKASFNLDANLLSPQAITAPPPASLSAVFSSRWRNANPLQASDRTGPRIGHDSFSPHNFCLFFI
jgi:hypothetical protein